MVIKDKKLIIEKLHKVISNDYPGIFHIHYPGENYKGRRSKLSYASVALLDKKDIKGIALWKEEIEYIMAQGITLHYIVNISYNPNDTTTFDKIIEYAITRYNLDGSVLICNHSEDIPIEKIEMLIIFGMLCDNDEDYYLAEEQSLDNERDLELERPIDFEELKKKIEVDE